MMADTASVDLSICPIFFFKREKNLLVSRLQNVLTFASVDNSCVLHFLHFVENAVRLEA